MYFQINMSPSCSSASNMFTWRIPKEDWSRLGVGKSLRLPFETMVPTKGKRVKWDLELYPKGFEFQDDDKLFVVSLHLKEDCNLDKFQVETVYRIKHGGNARELLDMSTSRSYFGFHSSILNDLGCQGLSESYKADELLNMADKLGALTFEFEMRTYPAPRRKFQNSDARLKFLNKFTQVEPDSGDVNLLCRGKKIPCHKFLLVSQSPVFKAMFGTDSKESRENVVKIVDSTPSALKTFVRFLYSGNLLLERLACDLDHIFGVINLANKYQVDILMDGCIDELMDIMDVDNVLKIMAVLDKVNAEDNVIEMVINFMKKNVEDVVENREWAAFVSDHPTLVKDLLLNMNQELLYGSRN
jgi:hypothetical protein